MQHEKACFICYRKTYSEGLAIDYPRSPIFLSDNRGRPPSLEAAVSISCDGRNLGRAQISPPGERIGWSSTAPLPSGPGSKGNFYPSAIDLNNLTKNRKQLNVYVELILSRLRQSYLKKPISAYPEYNFLLIYCLGVVKTVSRSLFLSKMRAP